MRPNLQDLSSTHHRPSPPCIRVARAPGSAVKQPLISSSSWLESPDSKIKIHVIIRLWAQFPLPHLTYGPVSDSDPRTAQCLSLQHRSTDDTSAPTRPSRLNSVFPFPCPFFQSSGPVAFIVLALIVLSPPDAAFVLCSRTGTWSVHYLSRFPTNPSESIGRIRRLRAIMRRAQH